MASGVVSAKVASGAQNLSGGLHQENTAANALLYLAKIDFSYDAASGFPLATKGTPPPNLSPKGAGRTGAFKEVKRQSSIPTSQQPSKVGPNLDKRGNIQPGKSYEFEVPAPGGGTKTVKIRALVIVSATPRWLHRSAV